MSVYLFNYWKGALKIPPRTTQAYTIPPTIQTKKLRSLWRSQGSRQSNQVERREQHLLCMFWLASTSTILNRSGWHWAAKVFHFYCGYMKTGKQGSVVCSRSQKLTLHVKLLGNILPKKCLQQLVWKTNRNKVGTSTGAAREMGHSHQENIGICQGNQLHDWNAGDEKPSAIIIKPCWGPVEATFAAQLWNDKPGPCQPHLK